MRISRHRIGRGGYRNSILVLMPFWKPLPHIVGPPCTSSPSLGQPKVNRSHRHHSPTQQEAEIQRRPLRIMGKKKQGPDGSLLNVNSLFAPGTSTSASPLGMSPACGLLMSGQGPQMLLGIRVTETAGAVHISTTIPV